MRVAVLTPLDERSAVAQYVLRAVDAAARSWDVEIWFPACDRPRWTAHPTRPFWDGRAAARAVAGHDLVVHVLGNSLYHLEILRAARHMPGLVVLHDVAIGQLVAAYDGLTGTTFVADAAFATGRGSWEALRAGTSEAELLRILDDLPLLPVALRDSLGVLTHSRWAAEHVRELTLGQVSVAPLPHLGGPAQPTAPPDLPREVVIVSTGVVNANKCLDRLIDAVAGSGILRERVRLRVVGPLDRALRQVLDEQVQRHGLAGRVELLGGLPRPAYDEVVASADAFVCLRDPVFEAASAGLLEAMATGRAVVVLDHGHYAELPDGVAVKVSPAGGVPALTAALEALVSDPARAAATGRAGAVHVTEANTAERYAETLVAAGRAASGATPFVHAVTRRRSAMAALGLTGDEDAVRRAANDLHRLFVAEGSNRA